MKHEHFCVHDAKADAYLVPFYFPNIQMAQRVFGDCIADKDHAFSLHPGDYTLFHIGQWDDDTGQTTPQPPVSLGNGLEYVRRDVDKDQLELGGLDPAV